MRLGTEKAAITAFPFTIGRWSGSFSNQVATRCDHRDREHAADDARHHDALGEDRTGRNATTVDAVLGFHSDKANR